MTHRDDVIEEQAIRAKKLYCFKRKILQKLDSFEPSSKYDVHFTKAATMCLDHNIDVSNFIDGQFYSFKPYPFINMIASNSALARYERDRESYESIAIQEFNVQHNTFNKLNEKNADIYNILISTPFDPLYTTAVCYNFNFPRNIELRGVMRDSALVKYLSCSYFSVVYKDLLPDEFKRAANDLLITS